MPKDGYMHPMRSKVWERSINIGFPSDKNSKILGSNLALIKHLVFKPRSY